MKACAIDGCDEEVREDSKSGLCHVCRASVYYWVKKRPAQVLVRRRKLTKYQSRLTEFFDDKGHRAKAKAAPEKPGKRPRLKRSDRRPADATLN